MSSEHKGFPNLAGDMAATRVVSEELRAVGVPRVLVTTDTLGEVPSLVEGKLTLSGERGNYYHIHCSRLWCYYRVDLDQTSEQCDVSLEEQEALQVFNEQWGREVRLLGYAGGMSWKDAKGQLEDNEDIFWCNLHWHVDSPAGLSALMVLLRQFGKDLEISRSSTLWRVSVEDLETHHTAEWTCQDLRRSRAMIEALYSTWGGSKLATEIRGCLEQVYDIASCTAPEGLTFNGPFGRFNVHAERLELE